MAERVGQFLGNYQLLRLLGRGAFAEVYLAEHRYLEVPAAIKILHVHIEPDTHEQFRREARTIAKLTHPSIVRVFDYDVQEGVPFLVMDYAPYGSLRRCFPKGTLVPLHQILSSVKQVAAALQYAHDQKFIHRDVKPENMLLGRNEEVVLSDFGIATIAHSSASLSASGQGTGGTIAYMAPEQIEGHPRPASDQYALGVVVYEWLCGERPFEGTMSEVLVQHLSIPPLPLHEHLPTIPAEVEQVVLRALAKDHKARFASVKDFADSLEEVCDATQPLALRVPSERLLQEQLSQPNLLPAPIHAPSPQEHDRSSSTTQPLMLTRQHTADREESVALEVLLPASQIPAPPQHGGVTLSRTNRQRFLRKVRAFWIAGVFEHSLHEATLVALGLQEQPDAVANPWQLVLQHPAGVPRSLPAGTRITEVYDVAEGELLILGAPGSGKSTLLLELARDLLERAEHGEQHPLPVVFNLSSWAIKQQRLADWLVEELTSTYQVPRKLGQAWVIADQILPLLDGLDEVAAKDRTACIESINTYRQEHGLLPLVVCSRSADYLAQAARVRLGSAVAVQPLTQQQVEDYLASGGEPLWALRVALQQDAALRELTSTPLMLSILTLTYHGMPVEDLVAGASLTDRQQQIFKHYVERMLRHRGTEMRYTQEQTTHWLTFLAQQMKQHNQTVFYIEHLQPNWLSGDRMRQAYDRWALRFPAILMGMLVSLAIVSILFSPTLPYFSLPFSLTVLGGFIGWMLSAGSTTQQPHESSGWVKRSAWSPFLERLKVGVFIGLSIGLSLGLDGGLSLGLDGGLLNGLFFGLLSGLFFGLSSILLQTVLEKSNRAESNFQAPPLPLKPRWQHLIEHVGVRNGILVGLLLGLSVGLSVGLSAPMSIGWSYALGIGLSIGLSTGLIGGFLSVLLIGKPVDIFLADELVWSWKSLGRSLLAKRHMRTTLRATILIGLLTGLSIGLSGGLHDGLFFGLEYGLIYGLGFWLLLGLFQGVSSETIGDQHRFIPNQGIRHSARNGLAFGLISFGIVGLLNWLNIGLEIGLNIGLGSGLGNVLTLGLSTVLSTGLIPGLIAGLSVGLLAGLLNGGLACLRQSVVRLLLSRAGSIPWNYPRFLDYAAEHILLRKVGGSYIFVHRLLLEYFASLDTTPPLAEARAQKQYVLPIS